MATPGLRAPADGQLNYTQSMGGQLIAIVGTSSVGKTSAARQLQALLTDPYLVVGIDHFLNMFPQHWAGHPRGPGPGMWYEETVDPDGSARTRIRYGAAGETMLAGMRAAVTAMLECGNNIILDEMPLDESIIPMWKQALSAQATYWVHLSADQMVVEARESQRRTGKQLGNARGHLGISDGEEFDLAIDTTSLSAREVAFEIRDGFEGRCSVM